MSLIGHPPASGYTIPKMFAIKQTFPRPKVKNIVESVQHELQQIFPRGSIHHGARIGVTAGSRGISNIEVITKAVVDFLKSQGAAPFIVPAMGSHGGGTPDGQRKLIEHYGITEEYMGVPILADVDTVSLGRNSQGVEPFFSRVAFESDGIVLVNRVKPHTDYKGDIESGLTKICAIGLGKLDGAREFHGHLFRLGLGGSIRSATAKILETGKIIGGLAIVENAYHETARLVGIKPEELFEREKEVLSDAKSLMGALPGKEIDVLVCDQMGKNVSGTGLDTNIIGRSIYGYQPGTAWVEGMPSIWRIVVEDISHESEGNATGMGLVDFIPDRFQKHINYRFTTLNAMTGRAPNAAKTPVVLANTKDAILAALATAPARVEGPILIYAHDTLSLEHLLVSEAALNQLKNRSHITVVGPREMEFDREGHLISPFV